MTRQLHLTRKARAELQAIVDAIAFYDAKAAGRIVEGFSQCFDRLLEYPELGRDYSILGPNYHRVPFESFVVFYRPSPSRIEIVRILHASRDLRGGFPP